jgi:hypothetical protein
MSLSAREICNWFEVNLKETFYIEKKEQQDLDRIEFSLEKVGLVDFSNSQDDYIANHAIILRGVGTIQNEAGERVRLPDDVYEISLEGTIEGSEKTNGLEFRTERAHYSIELR